jgi:MSHA biogenesis protein MshO
MRNTNPLRQRGFTMIELIMVIVIMGVIGGMVAVFMKSPIDAYFDSARRAALTDVADTTVRRMARDIRKALPNSIRVPGTTPANQCLEFIPTKTGGRYRTEDGSAGAGASLNFAAADDSFNMLGSNNALPADQRIVIGDVVAVYNLGPGIVDAYAQDNTASVVAPGPVDPASAPGETRISISSTRTPASGNMLFPLASGSNRFHVIPKDEKIVAYVCSGGKLYRTASNSFASACPATGAVLADKVSSCNFVYNGSDLQRNALVQITVKFTDNNETVSLYHEVHVDNTP